MKKIVIITALLFATATARAGLLIEPYVGALSGTAITDTKSGEFFDAKSSGSVYGARLGWSVLWFWVAADYLGVSGNLKYNKPSGELDDTFTADHTFIDVGVDLPLLFRFWGGVGLNNKSKLVSKDETTSETSETIFKGTTAVRAGLGIKILMFFSVNLEYVKPTFTKYESSDSSDDISKVYSRFDQEMTFLTVSFPLDLF